jgi:hypothetical protein
MGFNKWNTKILCCCTFKFPCELNYESFLSVRGPGPDQRGERAGEEEGADPHLQERPPHLLRILHALRRLRLDVQAAILD